MCASRSSIGCPGAHFAAEGPPFIGRPRTTNLPAASQRVLKKRQINDRRSKHSSFLPQMNLSLIYDLNVTFRATADGISKLFIGFIRSSKVMPGYARHVLVIEDDAETADQLVDCLKS